MSRFSQRSTQRGTAFSGTRASQWLDRVACFTLSGDLDLATVATFRAHLAAAYDADGLVFDLQNLRYLDSSGLNELLDMHRLFAPSGRRIALVGPSPNIRRILGVLHLEDLTPAFPTVHEALAYLRSGGSERPLAGA